MLEILLVNMLSKPALDNYEMKCDHVVNSEVLESSTVAMSEVRTPELVAWRSYEGVTMVARFDTKQPEKGVFLALRDKEKGTSIQAPLGPPREHEAFTAWSTPTLTSKTYLKDGKTKSVSSIQCEVIRRK